MIFTEEPRYTFYPDVNGNLNLPESERVAVEIIRPTGFQSKEMKSVVSSREFYKDDQPVDENGNPRTVGKFKKITTEVKINAEYILRSCVGKIENLEVQNGDEVRKIKTGTELAECRAYGIGELIDAICVEVASDRMTDSKKKNIE